MSVAIMTTEWYARTFLVWALHDVLAHHITFFKDRSISREVHLKGVGQGGAG